MNAGFEVVVIGATSSDAESLQRILSALPADFPLPIVMAVHRSLNPPDDLMTMLRDQCALPLSEPEDKERIQAGHVYLAPADYHLLVEPGRFSLSLEAPLHDARPSIDILFETAADAYGSSVIAILMNNANADGAEGLRRIRQRGGQALAHGELSFPDLMALINPSVTVEESRPARAAGRRRS